MTIDSERLRNFMRQWATGVTLVTCEHQGEREGMTVSSFTSISLTPPLVLVSLEIGTATHELVSRAGSFAVSILEESQRELSDRFAGRDPEGENRFQGDGWQMSSEGQPIPPGALASIDCRVTATYPGGTHTIFLAEVTDAQSMADGRPLLYFDRSYHQLGR